MLAACDEAPRHFHVSNIIVKPRSVTASTTSLQENDCSGDPAQQSRPASRGARPSGFVPAARRGCLQPFPRSGLRVPVSCSRVPNRGHARCPPLGRSRGSGTAAEGRHRSSPWEGTRPQHPPVGAMTWVPLFLSLLEQTRACFIFLSISNGKSSREVG